MQFKTTALSDQDLLPQMAKVARKLLQIATVAKKVPSNLWLRLSGTFFLKLIKSLFIYLFICPCLIQISVDPRTCTEKQLFHSLFVAETSARRSINEVFPGDLGRSLGLTRQWTVGAEPSNFSWEAKKTVKWKVFAEIYTWFSKAALGIGQAIVWRLPGAVTQTNHCNDMGIERFHMTSRRPWCCSKPVLWELNSFLMKTLSFVPIKLHKCWSREWKRSISNTPCLITNDQLPKQPLLN